MIKIKNIIINCLKLLKKKRAINEYINSKSKKQVNLKGMLLNLKARLNVLRIYRKIKTKQCKIITNDMKYLDKFIN